MDGFYKAYIPTDGKKSLVQFKGVPDSDLLDLETARKFPEFAGVLADNAVLVDIDDEEQSQILLRIVQEKQLKCRAIKTSRGIHFLFYNNGELLSNFTHCKLAIGLTADIKGCGKTSYEVLKKDGVEREVIYDTGEYQAIPKWMKPVKTKMDLLNMVEGQGRNNALFSYILPLQQNDFSIDECKECIHIINEFILKDPLSETELNGILRDSAFQKPIFFNSRGNFMFDVFAKYLQRTHNIIRYNGRLYVYKDGYYQSGDECLEQTMVKEIPTLNQSKRKEVLAYLELIVPNVSASADAHLVAFKNGVLNVITGEMYDFSPEYIITNMIPHNYNINAKNELLDKTIKKLACGNEQVEKLLYQATGYCFYRRNELRKSFVLLGEKRNGKSTFLDMIGTLLGEENISNLDLSEIGDKFKTAELAGKLANIGDDINDEYIPNTAVFKKVVSGDKITVERKGKDPFVLSSYAKFFFSANAMPKLGKGKDSSAINDRLKIITFNAKFSKEDPDYDPYIKYKLREEDVMEALIVKAVEGLREVLAEQEFITTDEIEATMEEYERSNNPILLFIDSLEPNDYLNEPIMKVYSRYNGFCSANNFKPMSSIEFNKQMKRQLDLEVKDTRVDGTRVRIYKRSDAIE